jgi:hypothetical protein
MSDTYTIKVKPLDGNNFYLFVSVILKPKWFWQPEKYITGFTVTHFDMDEIENRVKDYLSLNKQFEITV